MTFVESLQTVFQKYAVFEGRARRSEYWWFVLANYIVSGVFSGLYRATDLTVFSIISGIIGLVCLVPSISVTTRRLHDVGKSGWWQLLYLTCIGGIVILIWTIMDSNPGDNQYGPNPKGM